MSTSATMVESHYNARTGRVKTIVYYAAFRTGTFVGLIRANAARPGPTHSNPPE